MLKILEQLSNEELPSAKLMQEIAKSIKDKNYDYSIGEFDKKVEIKREIFVDKNGIEYIEIPELKNFFK
jgi:ABC-type Zn uptake system ZnuABC Zn-binding protein ZnuA